MRDSQEGDRQHNSHSFVDMFIVVLSSSTYPALSHSIHVVHVPSSASLFTCCTMRNVDTRYRYDRINACGRSFAVCVIQLYPTHTDLQRSEL